MTNLVIGFFLVFWLTIAQGIILMILLAVFASAIVPDRNPESAERWFWTYRQRHRVKWEFIFIILPLVLTLAIGYFLIWPLGAVLLDALPWPWPRVIPALAGSAVVIEATRHLRRSRLHSTESLSGKTP